MTSSTNQKGNSRRRLLRAEEAHRPEVSQYPGEDDSNRKQEPPHLSPPLSKSRHLRKDVDHVSSTISNVGQNTEEYKHEKSIE